MIGYHECRIALPLRQQVGELKASPCVRIVDLLCVHKNADGTVETEPVGDLLPESDHEPGTIIDTLLTRAEAARTLNETPWTGPGYLFCGDLLPDFRAQIPDGSGVLAVLVEHRWATGLRDVAAEHGAYPVEAGWIGRDALKVVNLIPQEA
jgi:hypothetical protein